MHATQQQVDEHKSEKSLPECAVRTEDDPIQHKKRESSARH